MGLFFLLYKFKLRKMLRVLSTLALASTTKAAAGYDSTTPLVPMSDYSENYRTLDCW